MTERRYVAKVAAKVTTISHFITELYRRNLAFAIPFTILLIKLVVRWLAREKIKEVFKSLLIVPLDFVYIAIGLVLTGIAKKIPKFIAHYKSEGDAYFNVSVLLLMLILIAVAITWSDKGVKLFWQKWYAAWQLLKEEPQRMLLLESSGEQHALPDSFILTLLWIALYWTFLSVLLSVEVFLSFEALGGILNLYK